MNLIENDTVIANKTKIRRLVMQYFPKIAALKAKYILRDLYFDVKNLTNLFF